MRLRVIRQQTFCVMWKACDFVWYVNRHSVWCGKHATSCDTSTDILRDMENLLNCVWCGQLTAPCEPSTDIVCGVENLLSPCDLSTDILCDVENLLTKIRYGNIILISSCTVENLPCKTYSLNTFPQYDLIFLFTTFYFLPFPLLLLIILIYSSIIILLFLIFLKRKQKINNNIKRWIFKPLRKRGVKAKKWVKS